VVDDRRQLWVLEEYTSGRITQRQRTGPYDEIAAWVRVKEVEASGAQAWIQEPAKMA
jgi:hypothetical protein